MNVLKKLFIGSPARRDQPDSPSATLPPEDAIEQMSLVELESLINREKNPNLPKTVNIGFLSAMYRRAMEIAYHSHGTSNADRTRAGIIAKVTRETMLDASPGENVNALKAAIEWTENFAKTHGYGTLSWLLEEHQVPAGETVQFVMQPEYAHLLGPHLASFTPKPGTLLPMRQAMVAELLRTRRVRDGDSTVFIAHGLASSMEPATVALFSGVELKALRNAHRDYGTARAVFSDHLGLLPIRSSARGFEPQPDVRLLTECVALELQAEWWHAKEREPALRDFISSSKDPWQLAFVTLRLILSCYLGLVTIEATYGAEVRKAVATALPKGMKQFGGSFANMEASDIAGILRYADELGNLERSAEEQLENVDAVFLRHQLELCGARSVDISKAESEALSVWISNAVAFLTQLRVRFLGQLRFSMRALSEGCRLFGPSPSLGAIEITKPAMESKDPGLWEDVDFIRID